MEDSPRDKPQGSGQESPHPTASAPGDVDTFIAEAGAKVEKWEQFVAEQHQKRAEAAAVVQEVMDATGLSARGIDPYAPEFAQIAQDLEFRRQLSLHYGLKLDKAAPVDTSKPDVSRWRQRTNALKV